MSGYNTVSDESPGYDRSVEMLARMREGTRWRWEIEFKTFMVRLRPLTISEELEVEARTSAEMRRRDPDYRTELNRQSLIAKFQLELSSTSEPGKNDPVLTDYELSKLTNAELMALFKEYLAVCEKCDPSVETLTRNQIDTMVEALKKSPPTEWRSLLTSLSFFQLTDLCVALIQESSPRDS